MLELIHCAAGAPVRRRIATENGFLYGAQIPDTIYQEYGRLHFADQDWKNPDRGAYVRAIEIHRPYMATVLDLECEDQFSEVMSWAEEVAQYTEEVLIIPKYSGAISRLPRYISGKRVRLAFSVPTRYGGTTVPVDEFAGWPVHLLGGAPHTQMQLYQQMDVVSVDGNMWGMMALRRCRFFNPFASRGNRDMGYWPTIEYADGYKWGEGAHNEAFRRSCVNIRRYWSLYPISMDKMAIRDGWDGWRDPSISGLEFTLP